MRHKGWQKFLITSTRDIQAALAKNIPVIPVLIDRTPLPKPNELPEDLRAFAYRQAANIDTGVDFQSHVDRLIRAIDQLLERQDDGARSNAGKKSGRTELDTNRSVVGLLGNANLGRLSTPRPVIFQILARAPVSTGLEALPGG